MPLTSKGEEVLAGMKKEYGAAKGEEVFYASKNAGTITGVDEARKNVEDSIPASLSPAELVERNRALWDFGAGRPAPRDEKK